MYITESYWGEYMGGTDDSLTLLEYLAAKGREEIPVGKIFADFGLDTAQGDFHAPGLYKQRGMGDGDSLCHRPSHRPCRPAAGV